MDLKAELKKQGILGNLTMFLTLLGASGFFAWLFNLLSRDMLLSIMFVIMCITSIITVITKYQFADHNNKSSKSDLVLVESLQKERSKADNLMRAYIRLRTAYRKNLGMVSRDLSYGGDEKNVREDGKEHLQNKNERDLFMEAERLSRESGVPDDA